MDVNAPEFNLSQRMGEMMIEHESEMIPIEAPMTTTANGSGEPNRAAVGSPVYVQSTYDTDDLNATLANYHPDYVYMKGILSDSGSGVAGPLPVTALAFDSQEELLWMGNAGGHVTSYYGTDLQKYTSFQVHEVNDIRQMITGDFGLLSLTKNSLKMSIRRGLPVYTHNSELFKDMQSMIRLPSGMIIMGGHQEHLIEFDLERCKQVRITNIDEEGCVIIRSHPKLVCCGDAAGKVSFYHIGSWC